MAEIAQYRRPAPNTQPEYRCESYMSTHKRSPSQPLILMPQTLSEVTGPVFGLNDIQSSDNDLLHQHSGDPLGERIVISGRVTDDSGRPLAHSLIEIWQANAAGRYLHKNDQHDAPLDPNFTGCGRTLTDADGCYRFMTVKPGAYPWRNHFNAWRPAHIHFSLFGPAFTTRLVTQMYFPGDPLLDFDPIYLSIPDENARQRLISRFDWDNTIPDHALGFRFDIVLRGRDATPMEV
ncbi:MAG TPA: protocatechuate 3,4-dioxygenase subunit beta [Burkholderiaceae bacterium]|nr:protocatechuate 3,4-dioxygenase subunit beta [Burkholderiaceae bacterium]